jgi:hypothetical protein
VSLTGPNLVPVFAVLFNGVPGLNLTIISANEIEVVTPSGMPGFADVTVQGFGSETLTGAYEFIGGGQFVTIGPGSPGATGTPVLSGAGDLTVNGGGFTLSVSSAKPSAAGLWFLGLTEAAIPLEGGTLYPFPWLLELPILASPAGTVTIPAVITDPALSGIDIVNQMWFFDNTGPSGVATSTNGLRLEIP